MPGFYQYGSTGKCAKENIAKRDKLIQQFADRSKPDLNRLYTSINEEELIAQAKSNEKWIPPKNGQGQYAYGSDVPIYIYSNKVEQYLLGKKQEATDDGGMGDGSEMDNMLNGVM